MNLKRSLLIALKPLFLLSTVFSPNPHHALLSDLLIEKHGMLVVLVVMVQSLYQSQPKSHFLPSFIQTASQPT